MLLTKLIPPRSTAHKRLVSMFRKWIEEPHKNLSEACVVFVIGGRGCGKSTIASGLMLAGVDDTRSNGVVFRMNSRDVYHSVFAQIKNTIKLLDKDLDWSSSVHPTQVRDKSGKGSIWFLAKDTTRWDNFRLRMLPIPNRRFCWIENADELPSLVDFQRVIGILTENTENPFVVVTFNPPESASHWANRLVKRQGIRKYVFTFNYKNMEKSMLGNFFFSVANYLKNENPRLYRNVYEGKPIKR